MTRYTKTLLALSAFLLTGAAAAQGSQAPQPSQDPQPATKDQDDRIRSSAGAAAGGTGDPTARGDRVRGPGTPQAGTPPSQGQGRVHNEASSDREEGRGADARPREVVPGGRETIRQERRTP